MMRKIIICRYNLNCVSNIKEEITLRLCTTFKNLSIYFDNHTYDHGEGLQINDEPIRRLTNFRENKNMLIFEFKDATLKIFKTKNNKIYINVVTNNFSKFFNVTERYDRVEYFPPPCPYHDYHVAIIFDFFREISMYNKKLTDTNET